MKALNQKGKSLVVINMVQTDWNEALTKPSNMISTAALMLGAWIILLSLINIFGGGAGQAGNKVAWIEFFGTSFGIGGEAFVPYEDGFILDDAIFAVLGLIMITTSLRNADVLNWVSNIKNSDFTNNLIKGNSGKEIISSWLVVVGISFYIIWSVQNDTWVDPGVYSVMIAMVAFGIALNINSKVDG